MGGSISAGANNDEMIDNLIKSRYIRTPVVEKVFRSIDRAFYYLPDFKHTAYRDLAWKQGNLHLSAPCIYSEVLEHLKLEPGHTFLNIGSGTGYLSTLAGLILGPYGTNHGIEVHGDVVEYAYEKLEQFKKTCSGVDVFEFCEPLFVVGNVFNLNHDRRYDRIYCGAACPEAHQEHIKKFMKVGGILVLPCEDDLLKIVRTSEDTWEVSSVLPVSFSTLQIPDKKISSMISMPDPEPLRLQDICRSGIRALLRSLAEKEEPELTQKRKCKQKSNGRKMYARENCVVIPVFEDPSDSRFENFRPVAFERLIRNLARNYQNLNDNSYENGENDHHQDSGNEDSDASSNSESNENENAANVDEKEEGEKYDINDAEKSNDINDETPSCSNPAENLEVHVDNCIPGSSKNLHETETLKDTKGEEEISENSIMDANDPITCKVANEEPSTKTVSSRPRKFAIKIKKGRFSTKIKGSKKHSPAAKSDLNHNAWKQTLDEAEESASDSQPKKVMKREKLDSGISEESDDGKISVSNESSYSESTCNEPMEIDSDDSDFTEGSSCEENNSDNETSDAQNSTNDSVSLKYRMSMEKKIKTLPLPNAIKIYLNYNREFCISC